MIMNRMLLCLRNVNAEIAFSLGTGQIAISVR